MTSSPDHFTIRQSEPILARSCEAIRGFVAIGNETATADCLPSIAVAFDSSASANSATQAPQSFSASLSTSSPADDKKFKLVPARRDLISLFDCSESYGTPQASKASPSVPFETIPSLMRCGPLAESSLIGGLIRYNGLHMLDNPPLSIEA